MVYIGIDPSYTKTGVSYIDLEDKFILFKAITPDGRNDTYVDMVKRAQEIADEITKITKNEETKVILEEPLIISQKASSLGILSGVLATELMNNEDISLLKTIMPNAVANTNRGLKEYTSKTRKKVSRQIVLKYLEVFEERGYKVVIYNDKTNQDGSMRSRVLSSDEAESFIMLIILLRDLNVLEDDLVHDLIKINRGLNTNHVINQLK